MSKSELEAQMELQIRAAGLPEPVTELRFCDGRRWRFDFCWPGPMVALECEGGTWSRGRHTRPQGFEGDCEKYSEAALLGWRVIRATTAMVEDGRALDLVRRALEGGGA